MGAHRRLQRQHSSRRRQACTDRANNRCGPCVRLRNTLAKPLASGENAPKCLVHVRSFVLFQELSRPHRALDLMNAITDFLGRVLSVAFKLALGLAGLVFLLSLLLASLVVVLGMSLWALLTGRKPAPVMVFERFRQTSQRYAQGAWVRPSASAGSRGDVVDVQAHEVPDSADRRHDPLKPGPRSGGDPMARMQH
jgi:hypothetical protein